MTLYVLETLGITLIDMIFFFNFTFLAEWIDFPRGVQHLPNGKVIPGNNNSYDKCRRMFDLVS